MTHFFAQVLAFLVALSQLVVSPFAAVTLFSGVHPFETPTATPVMTGLSQAMSPTTLSWLGYKQMWFSGKVEATDPMGSIYQSNFLDDTWSQPKKVFSIPGFVVSDPSVIEDPSHRGQLLLFYSIISEVDATSSIKTKEKNLIGMARSTDYGTSWQDMGIVIGQENGLDARGGWSPSALVVKDEIWLYYSTNYPGAIEVYRTRLRSTDYKVIGTDRVHDDALQKNLEGIHVSVLVGASTQKYVMYLNKDFSKILWYTSNDGMNWHADEYPKNVMVKAPKNGLVAAPYAEIIQTGEDGVTPINLFFAGGSVVTKTFDSLQTVPNISAVQTHITYQDNDPYSLPKDTSDGTVGSTSQSGGGGSGGGGSSGLLIGALGIAGVIGLAFLLAPAAVVPKLTGIPFGGFITLLTPCVDLTGIALWMTVVNPAGIGSGVFIWSLSTIPFLFGPPTHLGQAILGMADVPYACYVGFTILPGLRIQYAGTSLIP